MKSILTFAILILLSNFSLGESLKKEIPNWLSSPPKSDSHFFSVGEARDIENKDDALERAWISSLLRFGMTQFPELGSLRSESEESLHSANYNRKFVLQLESINWKGLSEVEEKGSPYIVYDEIAKTYTVYRLLKWSKKDLAASKAAIRLKKKNEIPSSPEVARKVEETMIDEIQKITALNKKIETRDAFLSKVLMRAKCGVSIDDLTNILGSPDRHESSCYYFWGTYEVFSCKGQVDSVTPNNGEGKQKSLCRNY
jgi:hypothetical protein